MSKIKFGNFITYRGKNLKTPQAKAVNGNLVFAEITEGADQGYYIFGGVAGGHLVTYEVFKTLKEEVAALDAKVGDLSIGEGESKVTYKDVPAYVAAYVSNRLATLADYKVKDVVVGATSIAVDGIVTLGNAAQRDVAAEIATGASGLATAGQVADAVKDVQDAVDAIPTYGVSGSANISVKPTVDGDKINFELDITDKVATKEYVDEEIGKLGDVMSFIGVVTEKPTGANVTLVGSTTAVAATNGDVVTVQASGEEYIWTGTKWIEIGKVGIDEAVTSLTGSTYVTLTGEGSGDAKTGNVTVAVEVGEIKENGKAGLATAADVYAAVEAAKDAATVTGASGYLKVDDNKNVVVDAAQVELGATGTSTKLVTLGYVEGQLESISNDINDAKKHSSVVSKSDYIGVTGVTTENGSVEYQVSLKANALNAANHSISEIKIDGEAVTTATTVQEALQDLFESDKVASEGLTDLNDRLEAHIGSTQAHAAEHITYAGATGVTGVTATNVEEALDDLYSRVEAAALSGDAKNITYTAGTGVVTGAGVDKVNEALDDLYTQLAALDGAAIKDVVGDAYVGATTAANKNGDLVTTLTTVLADVVDTSDIEGYAKAEAKGLATDAYVQDYVAYSLAWEVLAD